MSQAPLSIRLLGELQLRQDGEVLPLPASKKTRALLGFLVAAGGSHRREKLCALLWEGPDDPRAQLRWSLTKLRPVLDSHGVTRLLADREHVSFQGRDAVVDDGEIRTAAASLGDADVAELRRLDEKARGELMEGLDLPDAYRFQQWLVAEREAARGRRVAILQALLARLSSDPREALGVARTWVQTEPFADAAHAAVVRALGALGQKREALEHYDAVRVLFERELGSALSSELEDARRSLAARPAAPREAAAPASPHRESVSAHAAFVGRREVLEAVERWMSGGAGPARFLLVLGEPGVGKTCVLAELSERFASRGESVSGRAFLAERIRPYGALVDALRGLPEGAVPESLREDLAALLPELGPAPAAGEEHRLFRSVEQLLSHRARSRRALLVCLDDVHWLDEATAGLLHFLSRSSGLKSTFIAMAARSGELAENVAVTRLLRELTVEHRLTEIVLPPMTQEEVLSLVAEATPHVDARRVFTESEGIPLVALEVARSLALGEEAAARSYEDRLEDRFERLTAAARALLPWAAALGRSFPVDTLAAACGLNAVTLLPALQELVDKGLLRPAVGGFDFSHDLVRRAAYRRLAEPSRPLLHREIARALATRPDPDGLSAADVARHAGLGGENELAARAANAAAERCLRLFARAEAAELAAAGLRAACALPDTTRLPLELSLLSVHVRAGQRPAAELAKEIADLIARASAFPALVARAFFLLAVLHHGGGESAGASAAVLKETEASRGADERTQCFALANSARCLLQIEREVPRARAHLAEARLLAESHRIESTELFIGMGFEALFRGEHDEAVRFLEQALELAAQEGDHWRECIVLVRLARLELERERPVAALARCEALRPLAEKMGEGSERAVCAALTALAELSLARDGAASRLESALAALRDVDTKWDLAFIQNLAAEIELGERAGGRVADADGARASADRRAEEALRAAEVVGLRNERAIARSLLSRVASGRGDHATAAGLLADIEEELDRPDALSARACDTVARSLETIAAARR